MKRTPRAAIFDVDGVLIDSLAEHLRICADEARALKLDIAIPSASELRRMVASGTKVSPMLHFFLAVGFPHEQATLAVSDYQEFFMARYRPRLFAGVGAMLHQLRQSGLLLGLVTSNIRSNTEPVLGEFIALFEPKAVFYLDTEPRQASKSDRLKDGARNLALLPSECAYVGDQPADVSAAQEAGIPFLGVTYGWGILPGERRFEIADSVSEIPAKLLGSTGAKQGAAALRGRGSSPKQRSADRGR